jgi:hypothetical protein
METWVLTSHCLHVLYLKYMAIFLFILKNRGRLSITELNTISNAKSFIIVQQNSITNSSSKKVTFTHHRNAFSMYDIEIAINTVMYVMLLV